VVIKLAINADGILAVTGTAEGKGMDGKITQNLKVDVNSTEMTQDEIENAQARHKNLQ